MALEKAPYNEGMYSGSRAQQPMTKARMFGMGQAAKPSGASMNQAWQKWFDRLRILVTSDESGTTANRPTSDLYIGRRYFDTTLGKPIWVSNASTPTWVDATGASV